MFVLKTSRPKVRFSLNEESCFLLKMFAVFWEDNPSYLPCQGSSERQTPVWWDLELPKGSLMLVWFSLPGGQVSMRRLTGHHAMLLEELSREVNHMRWESLTLEPSQRVGLGCSGGYGYLSGNREFQGQWKLEFSYLLHGSDSNIFILTLEEIIFQSLGERAIEYQLWAHHTRRHSQPVWSLNPHNNFARLFPNYHYFQVADEEIEIWEVEQLALSDHPGKRQLGSDSLVSPSHFTLGWRTEPLVLERDCACMTFEVCAHRQDRKPPGETGTASHLL